MTILALDGETFGWHQPGQWSLLEELFSADPPLLCTVSEALASSPDGGRVAIGRTSWGTAVRRGRTTYFPKWENPDNEVHRWQWELLNLAIKTIRNSRFQIPDSHTNPKRLTEEPRAWLRARELLDRALHSDQFFWAEGEHTWHPEMIQKGATLLRDSLLAVPDLSCEDREKAEDIYAKIISTEKSRWGSRVREIAIEN